MGDLDGAIANYRQAVRFAPDNFTIYTNLAGALKAKGDVGGAVAVCREAIQRGPTLPEPYNLLGMHLAAKGDLDGAIAAHRTASRVSGRGTRVATTASPGVCTTMGISTGRSPPYAVSSTERGITTSRHG